MVRAFELFEITILSKDQRQKIGDYIRDLSVGKFRPMMPTLRQLRFRNKRINFDEIIAELETMKTMDALKSLKLFRNWNYDEMISDVKLLKALVQLTVPKGRIARNLKGTFTVEQEEIKKQAEVLAKLIINQPKEGSTLTVTRLEGVITDPSSLIVKRCVLEDESQTVPSENTSQISSRSPTSASPEEAGSQAELSGY